MQEKSDSSMGCMTFESSCTFKHLEVTVKLIG